MPPPSDKLRAPELSLKFIHTADIHLDSPLTGLAAYRDAPTEMLRTATRDAFRNLVIARTTRQRRRS